MKICDAKNIIEMLETATATARKEIAEGNLEQITELVCAKVNMPQLMQNPLFKRTIQSHFQAF